MTRTRSILILCIAALFCPEFARAGNPNAVAGIDRVRVAASDRYKAKRIHRFALGGGYRDLWETEIELPLLRLEVDSGPLVPYGRFGGLQTAVLAFKAPDGRAFTFRGTDKDPSQVLPMVLRDTPIQTLVRDQMAAQHPGGPVAATVISEAAGLLTIHERMVVMPDDPALGKYREEFAGMVGTFFEFPLPAGDGNPGFHEATEIIGHEEFYERLARSSDDQVDVEAFLRARLFNILIGDFDRHRKQWRWAKIPGNPRWQPIPEDRDMAFVRYDGAGPRLASIYVPILQEYSADYPGMKGLTLHGWEQDRWLLAHLSWEQWEPIARDIKARITDDVIEQAISAMPAEYVALDGDRLRHDLRGRRDQLMEGARSFYEHLAREVDVQTSDDAEAVDATWGDDGSLLVEVRRIDDAAPSSPPVYSRRFESSETQDVRVYLRSGDDRVTVTGSPGSATLRVIAGSGRKLLDDSSAGKTRLYDEGGNVEVTAGPGTVVDERPYVLPEPDSGFVDVENVPPRDWGTDLVPLPDLSYEKDVVVFIGATAVYTRYGFRKHPWSSQHRLSAGWATEAERERISYSGIFRFENSDLVANLDLNESGIEILRFYGAGNDTDDDDSDDFFRVRNRKMRVAPSIEYRFKDERARITGGPWMEYWRTKKGDRLIDIVEPYGSGNFGLVGAFVNLKFDTRGTVKLIEGEDLALPLHDNVAAGNPTSGFLLDVTTEMSPSVWDIDETWGAIEGSIAGYWSVGETDSLTLAARVGGRETWGTAPYFKAAYIGGGEFFSGDATVRGLRTERFIGNTSVFFNLDLRAYLGRIKFVVPMDYGLMVFGDVGRVFLDGESSKNWHPGAGVGMWFAPLARTNAISFAVATSEEQTLFYMRFGFFF